MKLVVFDLDGTLAKTFAVDAECFVQAFVESLGLKEFNSNWSDYEHVTDSGIVNQIFRECLGRTPRAAEVSEFIDCFVGLLQSRYRTSSHSFGEIPGAASFLKALTQEAEWGVAIATGSWQQSARWKLEAACLDTSDYPAAFAEDGPAREAIVKSAIERASLVYQQNHFEKVVSVGDAIWDVQTARRLGLPFVGVGNTERAAILKQLGTSHVLTDFRNYGQCVRFFEEAKVPEAS